MKNQFCSYEIALKLKELGFDEPCLACFTDGEIHFEKPNYLLSQQKANYIFKFRNTILAPLWQQVIDWFRDKYHTNIEINRFPNISKWGFIVTDMTIIPKQQTRKENINMSLKVADVRRFDEYFECREQAILKAIELITPQQ